jgi:hypothetical protein
MFIRTKRLANFVGLFVLLEILWLTLMIGSFSDPELMLQVSYFRYEHTPDRLNE